MSCVTFDTLEDLWGLIGYLLVYGLIYASLNRWWSARYYYFLTQNSFLPRAFIYLLINVVVVIGSSYATWRLWSCENWDWSPIRLFISLIFIIAFSAYNPLLHVTKSFLATTIVMFVIALLVAAMIVYSFIGGAGFSDTFAGIIWIAIFIYTAYLLFVNFMLWRNQDKLINSEKEFLDKQREIKEKQELVDTQELEGLTDEFNASSPNKQKSVSSSYSSLSTASKNILRQRYSQSNKSNQPPLNINGGISNLQNQEFHVVN